MSNIMHNLTQVLRPPMNVKLRWVGDTCFCVEKRINPYMYIIQAHITDAWMTLMTKEHSEVLGVVMETVSLREEW